MLLLVGLSRSSSRPGRVGCWPRRSARATRRSRASRRPLAGRTSTWTTADSPAPSSSAAPSRARSGSVGCSARRAYHSGWASRSAPPPRQREPRGQQDNSQQQQPQAVPVGELGGVVGERPGDRGEGALGVEQVAAQGAAVKVRQGGGGRRLGAGGGGRRWGQGRTHA